MSLERKTQKLMDNLSKWLQQTEVHCKKTKQAKKTNSLRFPGT